VHILLDECVLEECVPARLRASLGQAEDFTGHASIVIDALKVRAMVHLTQDIHPLTTFKRNTSGFVKRMKKTKRPVVLTVNGKAELVVQDASSYQSLLERLDQLETVEAIRRGLKDVEQGRVHDAREALEELRVKLALPR
jgi:prevent-host-death family protein